MNRPPSEYTRIPAAQLEDFGTACLVASGMPADQAAQLAQLLTNSDLRGVHSHGTRALAGYCNTLRQAKVNPNPTFSTLKETDTSVLIDGDGGLGYAPTMLATEKAMEKARAQGVAIGAACGIGHYGSAGHYVRRAMAEGFLGFSVQGAYPQYYRSNKGEQAAYYGNPPLCFGLPSQDEPPLVLDGATCIMADYWRGPEYEALQELIPAAFFKSMGYTGVGTALGGVFVGQATERAQELAAQWPAARLGSLVLLIDIGLFVPAAQFRDGIDQLVRGVRDEMLPLRGYDEATLPGTVEQRNEAANRVQGAPIAAKHLERLEQLGAECGVTPPWQ